MGKEEIRRILDEEEVKGANAHAVLEETLQVVIRSAHVVVRHLDGELLEEKCQELERAVKKIIDKDAYVSAWKRTVRELKDQDADAMRGLVMDGQLGHKFEKMVEKNSVPVDYDSHPFMKAYREAVGDEDVRVIESETTSVICPVTLKPFEEPVTSKICGHTYSAAAIRQLIVKDVNGRVRCPALGCFHFIREKDLERNTSKDEMVARYAAQQAVEQEQQEAIDVESEVVVTMPPIIKEEAH